MEEEKISKETFLHDVRYEIEALKKRATPEEINRLNLSIFDPESAHRCIYGQLTGDCESTRARDLMKHVCIRVFDCKSDTEGGVNTLKNLSKEKALGYLNGRYAEQTWKSSLRGLRMYRYLSSLEGYICLKDANISGIIAYLKGETDTLEL